MFESKDSFINKKCEMCGKNDLLLSELRLTCNYGSKYDGERMTIDICGNCADKIYNLIQNVGG